MSWVRILKKSEKGSITLMVLTAMIFVLVVITASYLAISNKSGNQDRKISKIAQQYRASDEEMEQEYQKALNNVTNLTIEQARSESMLNRKINTEVTDSYGNKIIVPAGFKVTEDAENVTEGIVVEDKDGNQFVWVPVGTGTNAIKKEDGATVDIKLSRYTFTADGTATDQEDKVIDSYYQELVESDYGNTTAKDIEAFKNSVNTNHGYYIGRYEVGVTGYDSVITSNSNSETNWTGYEGENIKLVCKTGQQVWNYVTQNKASELSRNMYTSSKFTSDLINSYAWDTAIVFIQTFSEDTNYAKQTRLQSTLAKTGEASDGTNKDVKCNIYDMAGNTLEWSTETQTDDTYYCVSRGGVYNTTGKYVEYRSYQGSATSAYNDLSFRLIVYLSLIHI